VLHFGDFGDDTRQQAAVAAAILRAHARAPFDLALHSGDNVYQHGPDADLPGAEGCAFQLDGNAVVPGYAPPADPLFGKRFEQALQGLAREGRPVPVYLVLGNHDVDVGLDYSPRGPPPAPVSRLKACLEVAHRSPQWSMPGRHYLLDQGPARFIALDSNLLAGDYGGFSFESEVDFVKAAAEGCAGRRCFVVAHHPAATAGSHRDEFTPERLARLSRLEAAGGGRIAAWLTGHDHDLQHLRAPAGHDVLISGNGSRARPRERFEKTSPGALLLFASTSWGYGRLEVGAEGWTYRFENDRGEALHCCAAQGAGPCQPVACAP
jgi:3',5'-cyclic AMP phosphodiesterase CpdA